MLTIAICDDEKDELEKITHFIRQWAKNEAHNNIQIFSYSSAYELLDSAEKGMLFDIFILDILMPEMLGISLGRQLRNYYVNPILIFLTSSEDYYPDAFGVYAFQYLMKPINDSLLSDVLEQAFTKCTQNTPIIFPLKTNSGVIRLEFSSIIFAELSNHVCRFHLTDETIVQSQFIRTRFDDFIAPFLEISYFIKPHNSYIINMNYIQKLSPSVLLMTNGSLIPVTRSCCANLRQRYMDYALHQD